MVQVAQETHENVTSTLNKKMRDIATQNDCVLRIMGSGRLTMDIGRLTNGTEGVAIYLLNHTSGICPAFEHKLSGKAQAISDDLFADLNKADVKSVLLGRVSEIIENLEGSGLHPEEVQILKTIQGKLMENRFEMIPSVEENGRGFIPFLVVKTD